MTIIVSKQHILCYRCASYIYRYIDLSVVFLTSVTNDGNVYTVCIKCRALTASLADVKCGVISSIWRLGSIQSNPMSITDAGQESLFPSLSKI